MRIKLNPFRWKKKKENRKICILGGTLNNSFLSNFLTSKSIKVGSPFTSLPSAIHQITIVPWSNSKWKEWKRWIAYLLTKLVVCSNSRKYNRVSRSSRSTWVCGTQIATDLCPRNYLNKSQREIHPIWFTLNGAQ